jgi:hypothetical protein
MVLIEFLFAGRNIEHQQFHSSEKYGYHGSMLAIAVFVLGDTSTRDFA